MSTWAPGAFTASMDAAPCRSPVRASYTWAANLLNSTSSSSELARTSASCAGLSLLEMMESARVATLQTSHHLTERLGPSKHRLNQSRTEVAPVDLISLKMSGPARFKPGATKFSHCSTYPPARGKGNNR